MTCHGRTVTEKNPWATLVSSSVASAPLTGRPRPVPEWPPSIPGPSRAPKKKPQVSNVAEKDQ